MTRDGTVRLGTTNKVDDATGAVGLGSGKDTALARTAIKTPRRRAAAMPRYGPKRDIFIR